eukprot:415684_1
MTPCCSTTKHTCYDYLVFGIVLTFYSTLWWYRGSIAPIVDVLEEELHATASDIGFLSSIMYIGYSSMQLPTGLLLQIYSPEFITFISSFGLTITSLLFSISNNLTFTTIIQLFSGILIGPIWVTCLSIIDQRFTSKNVALLCGVAVFSTKIFLITATTIQARIYEIYNQWRPSYWVISAISCISAILTFIVIIFEQNQSTQIKYNEITNQFENSVDFSHRELDTFDGDNETDAYKIRDYSKNHLDSNTPLISDKTVGKNNCFCCKFSIYRKELRSNDNKSALFILKTLWKSLKKSITNYRNYLCGIWGFCMVSIQLGLNGLWFVSYFMVKYKYSRALSTLICGIFYFVQAFSSLLFGKLSKKYQKRKIFLVFGMLLQLTQIGIIYIPETVISSIIDSMYFVIFLNCIAGFGQGAHPPMFSLMREYNNYYECSDTATSFIQTIVMSAGFVTPYIIGYLLDYNWSNRGANDFDEYGDRHYIVDDYNFAFIIIPILVVVGTCCALLLIETNGENIDYSDNEQLKQVTVIK